MRTPRARTVDLGKVIIPSPPRSPGDERLEGRKVWVKLNVMDGGVRNWVQFMGTLTRLLYKVVLENLRQLLTDLPTTDHVAAAPCKQPFAVLILNHVAVDVSA